MKTTNEGFLANTLRRLPRHGVKALAAGAVLIAAALPLAVASSAGAAGSISTLSFDTQAGVGGNGTQASGASFGTGGSGQITINGSGFAHDGGTVTVTSNAPGVTFAGASESNTTTATVSFASTSATLPGAYNLTLTDDANPSGAVGTGLFVVNSAPSIASISLTTAAVNGATNYTETITGAAFVNPTAVYFKSAVNGTKLATVSTTWNSASSVTYVFQALNSITAASATPGAYNLTVTNADGGTTTLANALTVTANPITNLDPSAFPSAAQTDQVTINGSGFQQGAAATFPGCSEVSSVLATTWNSATSLTVTFVQATGTADCNVVVTNPAPNAGNGDVATLTGGLGFGEASSVAPTITATSDTTAIVPGSPASTVTLTGTGLSQYATVSSYKNADGSSEGGVTLSNPSGNNGTSETYTVSVAPGFGTDAGPVAIALNGGASFPAAVIVAGPVITSQTPADIPAGSPIGTIVTLTGTGFTPTVVEEGWSGTLHGNINYVNATTLDFVVTTPPVLSDNGIDYVYLYETDIAGIGASSAYSLEFDFTVGAAPTVTSITYKAGTTGVGVGAAAQTVTISGTNFETGVVVGNFKNANGVADPGVTAKVVSINPAGTVITATIAVGATDTNTLDSYVVTNTDGGNATSPGAAWLIIQPAPTVTAVAPATASANSTTAFTLTGTGFGAGATVTATADGTCGAATVASATSITVSCTFGATTATAAALLVTNANGGNATSATVLAAATAPAAPTPHATGEAGDAIIGRTVSVAVAGVGFYGQPSVTSTGNSVKAVVSKDNGTLLTVRVTVGKTTGPGEHTLTFTLANGDVFKANYAIIK